MNLTLMFRVVCFGSVLIVLVVGGTPAPAGVITTGDVSPGGAGSQPDPWAVGGDLKVGDVGSATLNVTDGGRVSTRRACWVGFQSGSTGIVTVTGEGSLWDNSESLWVGEDGTGILNVEAGAVVSNLHGSLATLSGSTGIATVTGSGSQWNNNGQLAVGYTGSGTLNIADGGVVSNEGDWSVSEDWSVSGMNYLSTGIATVTGSGSQWNNSSRLSVGNSGTGTLNVEAGGVVSNEGWSAIAYPPGSPVTPTVMVIQIPST